MDSLVIDLAAIAVQARQRRDDDLAFGYYLDTMWERENRPDAELDALVDAIAADVSAQVDCTACANCCRSLAVGVTSGDVRRLAQGLQTSTGDVIAQCIDCGPRAARAQEWGVMRVSPCPLLAGRLCSVYAHRPGACRVYPMFTPDFRWLYEPIVNGAGSCSIIFHVIDRLKQYFGW